MSINISAIYSVRVICLFVQFLVDVNSQELNHWVDSCNENDETHVAFQKMVSCNRTGLPVVDSKGYIYF